MTSICTTPGNHDQHVLSQQPLTVCDGTEYLSTHVGILEYAIRGSAQKVLTAINNRVSHPSFGYTKTSIRADYNVLLGAIGMYMVVTGQANHVGVPGLAQFRDDRTTVLVERVNVEMKGL